MKKVLIVNIGGLHHKNLHSIKNYKNISITEVKNITDIPQDQLIQYDAIYSPSQPIEVKKYRDCTFVFGPHFSVFPDDHTAIEMSQGPNSIYIQPSKWAVEAWKTYKIRDQAICKDLNIMAIPFGVDTERFKPMNNIPRQDKTKVFLYTKGRHHRDITAVVEFLKRRNIEFKIFSYNQRYNEDEYLEYLRHAKYGVWVGIHESQGFALEEALSCDVPLFVWSVTSMNQEIGPNYNDIPATTIPYWDQRCGEYFHKPSELESKFELFLSNLDSYKPRDYVLENLSFNLCESKLIETINELHEHKH